MRISRQEAFDNHSRLMERDLIWRRFGYDADRNLKFVLSRTLPLPGRILEIGTGKGRFLTALLSHVPRVTTIDIDPAEQRCARLNVAFEKLPGRARFMIADAASLPWPEHSFDSVVSVNALHHMKNIPQVVGEVLRVAKPAGKIVLADFNTRGFAIMDRMHRKEGRVHECIPYRFKDLMERFAAHGWTAVLRSDDCQAVLIAVKASAGGGGKKRKVAPVLKGHSIRWNRLHR
ncbi:MAG: class I SAM-dependent methyltransferase [Kiritimatiellia bacterium]|jgi:ubiquinone/menaquinone biosynthesis C-methylase UbiE